MPSSFVSTEGANTSTVPLGLGATFTGAWEDIYDFTGVTVTVFADQASAASGLLFQWSNDGVTAHLSIPRTLAASVGQTYESDMLARFFRVVLANGGVAQGYLSLQSIYRYHHSSRVTAVDTPIPISPVGLSYTNRSLAVTAGGVAQQLMPANTSRKAVEVINPLKNAEIIWINYLGGTAAVEAAGSIPILPAGSWAPFVPPLGAISVLAPTTGTTVTAGEA